MPPVNQQPELQQSKPRILICRLSHIGDCILTLPMLTALREARPAAWIAWALESPTPQLLERHPHLDQVIQIPKGWLKSPRSILAVRRTLREHRFDIAIDPQGLAKSALLAQVSGAKVRVGFAGKHGRELSTWFNNCKVKPQSSHLVDRSLELLQGLGIRRASPGFHLPVRETASCYIEQFLERSGMPESRFVVINPGATWASKRWENERFAALAAELKQRTGLGSIVAWAGEAEAKMARQIVEQSAGAAILAPPTDLPQLAALLLAADLFIGCDTGPLHLAAAMGTVCVGLYGPTRPQDSGAYGQQHVAIQNQYHAGSCRERRHADNQAMRTIPVSQVLEACCRALAAVRVASQSDVDAPRSVA